MKGDTVAHLSELAFNEGLIMKFGMKLDFVQNFEGQTPLMTALQNKSIKLFKMLLERGKVTKEIVCLQDQDDNNIFDYGLLLEEKDFLEILNIQLIQESYKQLESHKIQEIVSHAIMSQRLQVVDKLLELKPVEPNYFINMMSENTEALCSLMK